MQINVPAYLKRIKRISAILIYYSYEAFTKISNGLTKKNHQMLNS